MLAAATKRWLGLAVVSFAFAGDDEETQSKQAKDKGVFFWFGDDLAVDHDLNRAGAVRRKEGSGRPVIEGSRKEIANGFV